MALTFAKKSTASSGASSPSTPKSTPQKASNNNSPAGWMKKGAAAAQMMQQEEAKAELAKQEAGKMWRFWMPDGADRQITFLDGNLDDEGMLDIFMFYEHSVRVNGNWEQFVCTAEADQTQPCPLCEGGDRPSLVGVMTVIDHSEHTVKKGPNAGKVIANTRKLFVAKRNTIKQLTKLAVKRGGLAGCTFDVSRTGDKEPGVGNQFDFTTKYDSPDDIAAKYDLKIEDVQPANYQEEVRYRSPEELIELGLGKATGGIGTEKGVGNLKDEL